MAFFKCVQTGNITEFVNDHDVVQMRSHPSYEEIIEEVKPVVEKVTKKTATKTSEE
jgi:hypothetical protein